MTVNNNEIRIATKANATRVSKDVTALPAYDNELRIALFVNEDRAPNSPQPILRGTTTVNGVEYYISLWGKISKKDGKKYWQGELTEASRFTDELPEFIEQ